MLYVINNGIPDIGKEWQFYDFPGFLLLDTDYVPFPVYVGELKRDYI